MNPARLLTGALLALLLAGCGFHLRRAPDLPPAMRSLYIAAPGGDGALLRQLRRELASDRTRILSDAESANATAVLSIVYARQRSYPVAIGVNGQALEYAVAYQVEFSLQVQGVTVLEPQTVTQTRQYAYNVANAVANQEQEDALSRSLIDEVSQLITFRVVAAAKNLSASPPPAATVAPAVPVTPAPPADTRMPASAPPVGV